MARIGLNSKTALGGLCLTMVLLAMWLPGSGPTDAQAAATTAPSAALPAAVLVQVAATRLVPGVTSDQLLEFELHWSCGDTGVFVERASGTVTFITSDGGHVEIEAAVREVQPGSSVSTVVQIEWDESDPDHRFMRRKGIDATASFTADSIRTVVVDNRGSAGAGRVSPVVSGSSKNNGAVRTSFN